MFHFQETMICIGQILFLNSFMQEKARVPKENIKKSKQAQSGSEPETCLRGSGLIRLFDISQLCIPSGAHFWKSEHFQHIDP